MASFELGWLGEKTDIGIKQGATFGPNYISLTDEAGAAFDLTGSTPIGSFGKTAYSENPVGAVFSFDVDISGEFFTWTMSASASALIPCSEIDENQDESIYDYEVNIELADGRIIPIVYGKAYVLRGGIIDGN